MKRPEDAELVHLGRVGWTAPDSERMARKADRGVGRRAMSGHQGQRLPDQLGQVEVERAAQLLAVPEDPDQPHRVVLEHRRGLAASSRPRRTKAVDRWALRMRAIERISRIGDLGPARFRRS
jgi:hypothetical protein